MLKCFEGTTMLDNVCKHKYTTRPTQQDEVKRQKNISEVETLKEQMRSSKESRFVATGIDRQLALMYIERKSCPYLLISMELREGQE
jgi:hypothetical protein